MADYLLAGIVATPLAALRHTLQGVVGQPGQNRQTLEGRRALMLKQSNLLRPTARGKNNISWSSQRPLSDMVWRFDNV